MRMFHELGLADLSRNIFMLVKYYHSKRNVLYQTNASRAAWLLKRVSVGLDHGTPLLEPHRQHSAVDPSRRRCSIAGLYR